MKLKNNFIYGFIIFMFSLFLYSFTRNYIIHDELTFINRFYNFVENYDNKMVVHDINEEYTYIIDNLNAKKEEMDFVNLIIKYAKYYDKYYCKFYIQGGAIRDALLNYTIRDIDLRTNCPMDIVINNLPPNTKYLIINNVIRIYDPAPIDISQISNILCNDFTINGFYYDYVNNILFNIYDSFDILFNKKLILGCNGFAPRHNIPFRFLKFKLRNYTFTPEIENLMFDKFYHLFTNNKDIYAKKVVYYTNEWYNRTEDKEAFLNEIKSHRLSFFFRLSAYTGARRGELLALRWADLEGKHLNISKSRVGLNRGVSETDTTKGGNGGKRRVRLDDETLELFTAHRKRQIEERLVMGSAYTETGYVFTREDGLPITADHVTHLFLKFSKLAGLRVIRLHDLRHLHATELLRLGEPLHVVANRLGHKDAMVTATIYAHVTDEQAESASDTFANGVRLAN